MAIEITQNFSHQSAQPNFVRDKVSSLPTNEVSSTIYDIGHRVYLDTAQVISETLTYPEGVYVFCKTSPGINNYDRWKLVITLDGEINLNGLTEEVQANTNKNTEQDTRLDTLESEINTDTLYNGDRILVLNGNF